MQNVAILICPYFFWEISNCSHYFKGNVLKIQKLGEDRNFLVLSFLCFLSDFEPNSFWVEVEVRKISFWTFLTIHIFFLEAHFSFNLIWIPFVQKILKKKKNLNVSAQLWNRSRFRHPERIKKEIIQLSFRIPCFSTFAIFSQKPKKNFFLIFSEDLEKQKSEQGLKASALDRTLWIFFNISRFLGLKKFFSQLFFQTIFSIDLLKKKNHKKNFSQKKPQRFQRSNNYQYHSF